MATLSELLTSAAAVRNETAADQNTALRVGNVLYSLTRYLQQYTSVVDITMKVSGVGVTITAKSLSGDTTLFDKTIALPVASNEQAGILTADAYAAIKSDIKELQEAFAALSIDTEELSKRISANAAKISDLSLFLNITEEKADTATRLLYFDAVVSNPTIEGTQGIADYNAIVFDTARGLFLAEKAGKYYNAFPGAEHYNKNLKGRTDRLFIQTATQLVYIVEGTTLRPFILSDADMTKLGNYPMTPLEIPLATLQKPGLMSAEDKTKLNKTKPVEEVTWTAQNHMNGYTEFGEFHIKGERTNANDGLPILNAASGHTIDAELTVLDSSLPTEGTKNDVCVTQILRLSNRTGGDGHIFIRTGQATTKSQLASAYSTYWGQWEKLMGIYEKNAVTSVDELDACTTNGMYSGIFARTNRTALGGIQFYPGDTFLMITANGYAATPFGTPQLTQILFKFPVRNAPLPTAANMYLRVAHWDANNKKWVFENFKRMATDADLSSQVATLTAKINQNAANIASANEAASEAITTAQEAQAAATTASENAAQAQELATQAKTDAARAQGTANSALSEAIEGKSAAANAFSAANNAQNTADAAKTKNDEQDERLMHIEDNLAHLGIAGRYWDEDNATSTAENYYGNLQALRDLPKRLGLGRYLVTDDRKRRKLDPKDSTKYLDGSPAALDGSEGQCMWCWNGFYANIWHEGSRLIKAITFDKPISGETSVWIPAGGISWLGAGVMDRTNNILCSVINDSPQFRGGSGAALNPVNYEKAPSADSPQITMLGMPSTNISTTNFGNYARKRGEGWEANWFVARFVVEFLFEIIMGTENSQAAFNAKMDANGLYQGGFGIGVTNMLNWNGYNGFYPVIPTSVGLEAGDGVCLVPYSLPQTDGAEGEAYMTFNVPVFFGLVGAGFGNLWQWTRGLIMDAGDKSLVYVTPSMYADYDPNTVADKILVAECPQKEDYIKRKSYQGLCCMPTEVGGTATTRFGDYFGTNAATSKGLRVRAAGGNADFGTYTGASYTLASYAATTANARCSAPLCYFEEDPIIPESEKIEI